MKVIGFSERGQMRLGASVGEDTGGDMQMSPPVLFG